MDADGIFVYGPQREGGDQNPWLARTRPEGSCKAWVPGRLFHLTSENQPAMVAGPVPSTPPPGPGWVTGEFVGYDSEAALAAALMDLDQLQGVPEERYARRMVPVLLDSGHTYCAWAYVFDPERLPTLERHAVELTDGDWAPYLDSNTP